VALADALDDFGLRVAANEYLGQVYVDRGAYPEAKALFLRHIDKLEGDRVRLRFGMAGYPSVYYRLFLGYCRAELGAFHEAIALGEQALHMAEHIDQPFTSSMACLWLGRMYLIQGDYTQASRVLELGVQIAEARQLGAPTLTAALGYARAMSGAPWDGLPLLAASEAYFPPTKSLRPRSFPCAPWSPTAISAWASSTVATARGSRPRTNSNPRQ
jgi:tetratricopeptide (TPR) repeat protein